MNDDTPPEPPSAPAVPDALARDAAALVDAADAVLWDRVAPMTDFFVEREAVRHIAAAALAPALRVLAGRARAGGAGPLDAARWLDGLADALGAGEVGHGR